MCRMGLPRILLVVADNQIETAKACETARTAINLGPAEKLNAKSVAQAIEDLARDSDLLQEFRTNAESLMDGLGATRVVRQLQLFRAGCSLKTSCETATMEGDEELRLRNATMADARMLLEWRSDAETSAASRSTKGIDFATHEKWLSDCLASYERRLFIAETNSANESKSPVGTVRIDIGEPCELSWTVAPHARRRGIGQRMVSHVASIIGLPTKAVTRKSNIASQKVAASAGFRLSEENGEWLTFCLEPERVER